jgi:hypothetical protein
MLLLVLIVAVIVIAHFTDWFPPEVRQILTMGCSGSKQQSADHKREADEYAKRKKMGFKDPGLEQVRKDAIKQKKKLKHVEDPDKLRKAKLEGIKVQQKKEGGAAGHAAAAGAAGGGHPPPAGAVGVGLSEDTINAQRNKLKRVKKP